MPEVKLTARPALGGFLQAFEGVTLAEVDGLGLVSAATSLGDGSRLSAAVMTAYGAAIPEVGTSSVSADGNVRLLGLQPDQMFLLFEHAGDDAAAVVAEKLGEAGYYSEQSDAWVYLRLSGPLSTVALERICMLDLHPDRFAVGDVSRTVMEHLGVIILREDLETFLLISPRSSAESFLEAVETSVVNVVGE